MADNTGTEEIIDDDLELEEEIVNDDENHDDLENNEENIDNEESGSADQDNAGEDDDDDIDIDIPELDSGDPKNFRKRINKVVYEREEEKRKRIQAEKELEDLKKGKEKENKEEELQKPVRPKISDYDDYDKYNEALADYAENIADYNAKLLRTEFKKETPPKSNDNQPELTESQKKFNEKVNDGRTRYEDFDDVALKNNIYSEISQQLVIESEFTADIAYYLGKNPDKADALARMGVLEASRTIMKIEDAIRKRREKKGKGSSAPAPIKPVSSGSKETEEEIDPGLPTEEYVRKRREKMLRDAKR